MKKLHVVHNKDTSFSWRIEVIIKSVIKFEKILLFVLFLDSTAFRIGFSICSVDFPLLMKNIDSIDAFKSNCIHKRLLLLMNWCNMSIHIHF